MRNPILLATTLAPFAAHAVVAATSSGFRPAAEGDWTGVGRMGGASAVAVAPHLVLTADHVGAGDFVFGGATYTMTASERAPKVKGGSVDLRLVTVAQTLPAWATLGTAVAKGTDVTMVGFGSDGVVRDDRKGYALTGANGVSAGGNRILSKETTKGRGPTLRAALSKEGDAVLAGGDSGGGWFSGGLLVGVSDFTYTKNGGRADYRFAKKAHFGSGAIDLTNGTLQRWLRSEIAADLASPSARAMSVAPVPEPGGLAALGLGALALSRRRRN